MCIRDSGRTFQESLQKALRGLEIGVDGFTEVLDYRRSDPHTVLKQELGVPGPQRIWFVAEAFRLGYSVETLYELTKIDPWFLAQIEELVQIAGEARAQGLAALHDRERLYALKRKGFSDSRLATLTLSLIHI